MTTKHAHYAFSYTDPSSDEHPVIRRFVLDSPKDMPTFDEVTQVFLGFLSEVHGYEITLDMLTEKAAAA
jgi:hypothetical protein